MADLFWSVATSYLVLSSVALVLMAALIVGYFPMLKWFPVIGQYVPVARLAAFVAVAMLCFLVGFRIADEREEAKSLRLELEAKEVDLTAAEDAAKQADEARQQLAEQSKADQERIERYAEQIKKRPNGACTLTDDDFDGVRHSGADR
jgi:hypothetical protein